MHAGLVERLMYRCAERALAGTGAPVIVNGRELSRAELERLVRYARRHGFLSIDSGRPDPITLFPDVRKSVLGD